MGQVGSFLRVPGHQVAYTLLNTLLLLTAVGMEADLSQGDPWQGLLGLKHRGFMSQRHLFPGCSSVKTCLQSTGFLPDQTIGGLSEDSL